MKNDAFAAIGLGLPDELYNRMNAVVGLAKSHGMNVATRRVAGQHLAGLASLPIDLKPLDIPAMLPHVSFHIDFEPILASNPAFSTTVRAAATFQDFSSPWD